MSSVLWLVFLRVQVEKNKRKATPVNRLSMKIAPNLTIISLSPMKSDLSLFFPGKTCEF